MYTQSYGNFATHKLKHKLTDKLNKWGAAKSPPHFCKYSTIIFRAL